MEFRDAIKECDGDRVLCCFRYLLPIFQNSGRKNYAIETLNFLFNHDFALSEREAAEFANVYGCPGRNIPHREHLNRLCKTAVKSLGANKTKECITRVAKALGTLSPVLDNFDEDNNCVPEYSAHHRVPSSKKDMGILVLITELQKLSVFEDIPNRFHPTFKSHNIIITAQDKLTPKKFALVCQSSKVGMRPSNFLEALIFDFIADLALAAVI